MSCNPFMKMDAIILLSELASTLACGCSELYNRRVLQQSVVLQLATRIEVKPCFALGKCIYCNPPLTSQLLFWKPVFHHRSISTENVCEASEAQFEADLHLFSLGCRVYCENNDAISWCSAASLRIGRCLSMTASFLFERCDKPRSEEDESRAPFNCFFS